MAIRARFWVTGFDKRVISGGAPQATVTLTAVRRHTNDNVDWAKYTPAGTITMSVNSDAGGAYDEFERLLGKDVAVLFEEIPQDE